MPKADLHHYLNQRLIKQVYQCVGKARGRALLVVGTDDESLLNVGQFLHRFSLVSADDTDAHGGVRADYEQIPFACGEFDLLIAWQVVDRTQHYFHVMHELSRVIKSGGKIFLVNISAFRGEIHSWLRGSAKRIHGLTQIMLAADQCHLGIEQIERVGLFAGAHPWLQSIERVCLPYAGGLSLGYIAVFERHEVGLTPLVGEWARASAIPG